MNTTYRLRLLGQQHTDTAALRKQIIDLAADADLDTLDDLIAVLDETCAELVARRDAMVEEARPAGVRPAWAVDRFGIYAAAHTDRKAAGQ